MARRVDLALASNAASSILGVLARAALRASIALIARTTAALKGQGSPRCPRLVQQRAIERIDFGAPSLFDMLQHGRPVIALPGMIEHMGARIVDRQSDAFGGNDGENFVEHALEQFARRR